MVAILFITTGLAYGIGAKTIKNDRDLIEKTSDTFKDLGMVLLMIFVFSQFITVWKQSNIGIVFTSWCANLLSHLEFDGIPLIVITIIIISISNFFLYKSKYKMDDFFLLWLSHYLCKIIYLPNLRRLL